jgi:hypothetical protein
MIKFTTCRQMTFVYMLAVSFHKSDISISLQFLLNHGGGVGQV